MDSHWGKRVYLLSVGWQPTTSLAWNRQKFIFLFSSSNTQALCHLNQWTWREWHASWRGEAISLRSTKYAKEVFKGQCASLWRSRDQGFEPWFNCTLCELLVRIQYSHLSFIHYYTRSPCHSWFRHTAISAINFKLSSRWMSLKKQIFGTLDGAYLRKRWLFQ